MRPATMDYVPAADVFLNQYRRRNSVFKPARGCHYHGGYMGQINTNINSLQALNALNRNQAALFARACNGSRPV